MFRQILLNTVYNSVPCAMIPRCNCLIKRSNYSNLRIMNQNAPNTSFMPLNDPV